MFCDEMSHDNNLDSEPSKQGMRMMIFQYRHINHPRSVKPEYYLVSYMLKPELQIPEAHPQELSGCGFESSCSHLNKDQRLFKLPPW